MKTSTKIIIFGWLLALSIGGGFLYTHQNEVAQVFGATANPGTNALWENSLAQPLGTTDANMYVTSGADVQGNLLPVGSYQCFTVDIGQPNSEFICGSVSVSSTSGLTLAISLRGLSTATGTTTIPAQVFTHRRGADVRITDFPSLTILNNQLNGAQVIPNPILYSSNFTTAFWAGAASNTITTLGYVNSSVAAGCGAGSTVASGCFQAATALQAASSTVLGSTGFNDILLSSYATDTPTGTSASGSKVVMSLIGGYISQAWLNLSQAFTFSGLLTSSGGFTSSATTTITDNSLTNNALVINALAYLFPSVRGASSTVLSENGSGKLTFEYSYPYVFSQNNNANVSGTSNSTTTIAEIVIPAGSNLINNFARLTTYWNQAMSDCSFSVGFGNGSATTSVGYIFNGPLTANAVGQIITNIDSVSASAQTFSSIGYGSNGSITSTAAITQLAGTTTVNLANQSYIEFDVRSPAESNCTLVGYSLEVL